MWAGWKPFGPVRIAQQHVAPKINRSFRFERVEINKPVKTDPPSSAKATEGKRAPTEATAAKGN